MCSFGKNGLWFALHDFILMFKRAMKLGIMSHLCPPPPPVLGKQRQEGQEFKVSLRYIRKLKIPLGFMRPYLKAK